MYLLRHSVYALVDALTGKFVLVDELVFVLYLMSVNDELVLVLVQVLCFAKLSLSNHLFVTLSSNIYSL